MCEPRPDRTVVACVGAKAISRDFAAQFVTRPAPPQGPQDPADPKMLAVENAVRTVLFAEEARRRGLTPLPGAPASHDAVMAQTLIAAETRHLSAASVSEEDARARFEHEPEMFHRIDAIDARVIGIPKAGLKSAWSKLAALSDAEFAAEVVASSLDATTRAQGGLVRFVRIGDARPKLAGAVFAVRKVGQLAGPVEEGDILLIARIQRVEYERKPFDAELLQQVRNVIAREQQRRALDALEAKLRAEQPVRVFADAVAELPSP